MAPHAESSAIGHALTLRRPLRIEQHRRRVLRRRRHADRLRQSRRRGPAEGRAARSRRLGHQHRVESRRRCDLFGHGGGRARRGAARHSGDCGVAAPHARLRLRLRSVGARPRRCSPSLVLRHGCRIARSSTSTCPRARRTGSGARCRASAITSPRSPSASIREASRTTGSKRASTSGRRTIAATITRSSRATSR